MAAVVCTVDLNKDLRRLAVSQCVKIKIEGANLGTSFRPTKGVRIGGGGFSFVMTSSILERWKNDDAL